MKLLMFPDDMDYIADPGSMDFPCNKYSRVKLLAYKNML